MGGRAKWIVPGLCAMAVSMSGCGLVPSDPELSDSAIRVTGSTVQVAVALCPGERVRSGAVTSGPGFAHRTRARVVRRGAAFGVAEAPMDELRSDAFTSEVVSGAGPRERSSLMDWSLRRATRSGDGAWLDDDYEPVETGTLEPRGC